MKVSELYNICLELIENGKAHYDVCLVDREDYDIQINPVDFIKFVHRFGVK